MPRKYVIKRYLPDTHYHVFNRAVYQQLLFRDKKDYWFFRRCLADVLQDMETEIECLYFALLQNHFHLLVFQRDALSLRVLMSRSMTRYALYFRRKYQYNGPLFESRYKAVVLPSSSDVSRIRRYIQQNPISDGLLRWPHVGEVL